MLRFPSFSCAIAMLGAFIAWPAAASDTVPEIFRTIAAKHDLSSTDLHAWAMAQTGRMDTSGKMVAWPWTVRVNGNRYQFKSREALHAYLLSARKEAPAEVAFGFDNHRLGDQSAAELWAELEPDAMLIRAALKLSGKAPVTRGKPFVIMPVMWPEPLPEKGGKGGQYDALILQVAREVGIDPVLLHTVIRKESAYRPNAVSHAGAMGLMQLMPATARSVGLSPNQYFDPYANLKGGAKYLKEQLKTFGNLELALAAYNAGPGNVKKYGYKIPPFAETKDYVATISARYAAAKGKKPSPLLAASRASEPPVAANAPYKIIYPATRADLASAQDAGVSTKASIRPALFRVDRTALADRKPADSASTKGRVR